MPAKPRSKKPHDPGFDVREVLYALLGVDLTAIEGIYETRAYHHNEPPGLSRWIEDFTFHRGQPGGSLCS